MSPSPIKPASYAVVPRGNASSVARVEKPSNGAALQQDAQPLKRRDYYRSADNAPRPMSRPGTTMTASIRYNSPLDSGFVAQVLGQILSDEMTAHKKAYDAAVPVQTRHLLDRKV